jgi:glutamate-ammonia-ligase adenylyltransferase
MNVDQLIPILDDARLAANWLGGIGIENVKRGHGNLVGMAETGMTLDLMAVITGQLEKHLPPCSDPDMALNNLERFVRAARNPLSLGSLIERDPDALPILVQIFSTSQHFSDVLVQDPEGYDLLRITEGQPVARDMLVDEICSEVLGLREDQAVMLALRHYKRRESLRIAYGDIVRGQTLETVTKQISLLADAICEAALVTARRGIEEKHGLPRRSDGQPARFVVLGLGKLGGTELNYSSDIDLMLLFDEDGQSAGPRAVSNQEYFDRLARSFVRLLTESTHLGVAYRVDLRLRPEGKQGLMVVNVEGALQYYDVLGRTWERQAFVKARPIAGDRALGREFLDQLQPWIYRRYLSRADITGIKALKRRIEQRTRREGGDARNVKTGHGGIRDIEFVIQFLQLLHGGDLPDVRTGNTLDAIIALERVGCLTMQERRLLEQNYAFLRKIEHRLQIMFDLQTHTMPEGADELRKVAIRTGYADTNGTPALQAFQSDYDDRTALNRKILDHLLHDAFGEEEQAEPEVDLVLDPDPEEAEIKSVLGRYGFQDIDGAYQNLMALSTEKIPFLSTRRCRHFLASIAPHLLRTIKVTPDPDTTLINLSKVSDSLGGKGVLWELFSFNQPTLQLYVRLCASSPYLSGILTSNPGMIDELMDSLVLDRLPTFSSLDRLLTDLCRGAEDVDPILHSFKNSQHLRVGVRDILSKEDIGTTTTALSDIAEVCLKQIGQWEYERLVARFGEPTWTTEDGTTRPCELITLAMGKLGGREPNYHSDLDVVFVYEQEGSTKPRGAGAGEDSTSNQHFFSELGQRIIKYATRLGPHGRLYEMDTRLRPTGKSGVLAVSLEGLQKYFDEGHGQLWERQALCKARPIGCSEAAGRRAMRVVHAAIQRPAWRDESAGEIRDMRRRLEETASPRNLKRGPGGTVDIEFIAQMWQLRRAADTPSVLVPGTLEALQQLHAVGCLGDDDYEFLSEAYRFLRSIEARLRLMNTTARHDIPDDDAELARLAYLLDYSGPTELRRDCGRYTTDVRARFNRLFDAVYARG